MTHEEFIAKLNGQLGLTPEGTQADQQQEILDFLNGEGYEDEDEIEDEGDLDDSE